MGGPAPSSAKAQLRQGWLDQQKRLVDYTRADWKAMKLEDHWMWYQPKGWSGDLFDWKGMSKPFSRKQSNNWLLEAIKSVMSMGVAGDSVITTTQTDYLGCMERAFRARHTNGFPRVMAHALGRRRGHGDQDGGMCTQGILNYVRGVVKQATPQ